MSLKIRTLEVNSPSGEKALNTLWHTDDSSDTLAVLIPGAGYTVDHPVLYHVRAMLMQRGCDVLNIQYAFQRAGREFSLDEFPALNVEIADTLSQLLPGSYRRLVLVGKSLGTPFVRTLAQQYQSQFEVSVIQLTPIQGAVELTDTFKALVVIGTADSRYSAETVAAYDGHPSITWRVFEGLNHGLEVKGNWCKSLDVLSEIVAACEAFMETL